MKGQTFSIRVITDTYMKVQRLFKYKYEVLGESNEHRGKVDLIFSPDLLRAGHHYEVRVNDQTENPRIVEVLRELDRDSPTDPVSADGAKR